jgi:hypothetical protein
MEDFYRSDPEFVEGSDLSLPSVHDKKTEYTAIFTAPLYGPGKFVCRRCGTVVVLAYFSSLSSCPNCQNLTFVPYFPERGKEGEREKEEEKGEDSPDSSG